ncbi:hypothetical protein [Arthrobacter sp. TMS2-4]
MTVEVIDPPARHPAFRLSFHSKNDHTVRYALGCSESPVAVSTCTYENRSVAEQRALPAADELTAAFEQIASENAEQQ